MQRIERDNLFKWEVTGYKVSNPSLPDATGCALPSVAVPVRLQVASGSPR